LVAKLTLDRITDQHAGQYAAKKGHLSPSTINCCGLRTLRHALALAAEWGTLERRPKLRLAKGERQRERVLSNEEIPAYLDACPQPWKDTAIIMLGTGMRPGEVFSLSWENVFFDTEGGSIQIIEGKSKTARRTLPMIPVVFEALKVRYEAQGCPNEGWVFPTNSTSGHLTQGTAKKQHAIALKNSKVRPFEPYCLRHTAFTNMGSLGVDAFTVARIAGHSSISMTQRYCHLQEDSIERAFAVLGKSRMVVTKKIPGARRRNECLVSSCRSGASGASART
jgi:integrase